jgi:serine/threonine protein kinase
MWVGSEKTIKAAYRELILLKNNNHPNLMSLLDVFIPVKANGPQNLSTISFVIPKMAHTVHDFITIPAIPVYRENISYLIYQVLLGTAHLHKSGITHRDLTPANIGIDPGYHVKIMDYGFSREVCSNMTFTVGTERYLAPEAGKRKQAYTEKSQGFL